MENDEIKVQADRTNDFVDGIYKIKSYNERNRIEPVSYEEITNIIRHRVQEEESDEDEKKRSWKTY